MKQSASYYKEIWTLLGDRRKKVPALLFFFLLSSFLDLAGIGLIAPYVGLIIDSNTFMQSDLYSYFIVAGFPASANDLIILLGITLVVVFFLKAVIAIFVNKAILNFSFQFGADLRSLLMGHYQSILYTEYIQRNSSEYIYSIHGLVAQFSQGVLQSMLRLASEGLVVLLILALLAWQNGSALLLLIGLMFGGALIYDWIFKEKVKEYGRLTNQSSESMFRGIQEGIEGLKEVRILGKEKYFHNMVSEGAKQYASVQIKSSMVSTMPRYLLEFVLILFIVLVVIGSVMLNDDIAGLIPTLSMFGVASLRLIPSVTQIITSITKLRFSRNSVTLLHKDLSRIKHKDLDKNNINLSELKKNSFESIELNNIEFTYPQASQVTINNVSLCIKSGESIGLIGASGSGKSTLIDVLLGLLEPNKGEILYNGQPLSDHLLEWRSQVAYLPQKIFLIDNTLKNNIALGVPDDSVDVGRLNLAIKQAQIDDLVKQLSDGINTTIGEGGIRLSGGQRQRVALARAFYHNRSILIMDESTSALDSETEKEIVNEIQRLKGKITLIVIAHRLSTIEYCDSIYRLSNGEILEKVDYKDIV
jgi:ABC-type multidrug transport system fused ATPase/permease subunit